MSLGEYKSLEGRGPGGCKSLEGKGPGRVQEPGRGRGQLDMGLESGKKDMSVGWCRSQLGEDSLTGVGEGMIMA